MSSSLPPQLSSPYHLVHYAVLLCFFAYWYPLVLRPQALETALGVERLLSVGYSGCCHELEVGIMIAVVFLWKVRYCRNFDEVWHRVLLHAKILSLMLAFLTGNRAALLSVMAIYVSMLVLLVPPKYRGESQVVELRSALEFTDQICNPKAAPKSTSFLVLCFTPWNDACHFFEPIFSKLSVEYSSQYLQFRSINLDTAPELANDLQIDTTTRSKQLPSILLYFRGRLIRRLPPFKDDGKVVKTNIDKKGIIKYFELDLDPTQASFRKDDVPVGPRKGKKTRSSR